MISLPFTHSSCACAISGGKTEDVYHFIAYVPFNGCVFELDGLKPGPINLGSGENWIGIAKPAIEERMARYSASETAFALLSVCEKKETGLQRKLRALQLQLDSASEENRAEFVAEVAMVQNEIDAETHKVARQRQENVRRKHNYLQVKVFVCACYVRLRCNLSYTPGLVIV